MNRSSIYMALVVGLALIGVFVSEHAQAYTVGANDVGGLDTFISSAAKVGNPDSEALWVQGQLGDPTIDWTVSSLAVPYSAVAEDASVWAFELSDSPKYFLIKNSNWMALFQNVNNLDWGVVTEYALHENLNIPTDPWEISHVTELTGEGGGTTNTNNVPEPALFLLMLFSVGIFVYSQTIKGFPKS